MEVWQLDKKYNKLLRSIRRLRRFLDELMDLVTSEDNQKRLQNRSYVKEVFLSKYDELDDLVEDVEKLLIQSGLDRDKKDLDDFFEGMFKKPNKPRNTQKNNFQNNNNRENSDFEIFMESMMNRSKLGQNFRQSPKFRKFNKSFNYQKDWADKPTDGDGTDELFSLEDKLIQYHFPNFDRKNNKTYPPKARWVNYADKYSKEYLEDLESPWCFRSALQCFELSITSQEFEFELKKMEFIGQEAVDIFLDYCSQLGVFEVTDSDINFLKKLLENGEVDE